MRRTMEEKRMTQRRWIPWMTVAAIALAAGTATAGPKLADMRGHLVLGYAQLFTEDSPGGSLSAGAGVDLPVTGSLRAGIDVGYHLLGSRTLEQGSLSS